MSDNAQSFGMGVRGAVANTLSSVDRRLGRNGRVVLVCVGVLAGMIGLSYASVPLYNIFCRVTGYGGTTQEVEQYSDVVLDREMTVRFDGSTSRNMPWEFKPEQRSITLRVGESGLAFYTAHNPTSRPIVGRATYNVTPQKSGLYFAKVECFCFTEQVLLPGESVRMPVTFFLDPALADDPHMREVSTVTLSYTFFVASDVSEDSQQKIDAYRQDNAAGDAGAHGS